MRRADKTDQAFHDQVTGAEDDAARLEIINAAGFAVTTEDLEAVDAALTNAEDELSDAQLGSVSGGCVYVDHYPRWVGGQK